MITTQAKASVADVATHYDELDPFYRRFWGTHMHHGLWENGDETQAQATRKLTDLVLRMAHIRRGDVVCDIGCGYGGTSRILAAELDAKVHGFTVSRAQFDFASKLALKETDPTYVCGDWCENDLDPNTVDAAIAIESTEHFADKPRCFREAWRVLKPGGRIATAVWLAKESPSSLETRQLLEPICKEGRLPSLGAESDYRQLFGDAGFDSIEFIDLSAKVRKTWSICLRRLAAAAVLDPSVRRALVDGDLGSRDFAPAVLRIWIAYLLGSMRYGVFAGRKPLPALN